MDELLLFNINKKNKNIKIKRFLKTNINIENITENSNNKDFILNIYNNLKITENIDIVYNLDNKQLIISIILQTTKIDLLLLFLCKLNIYKENFEIVIIINNQYFIDFLNTLKFDYPIKIINGNCFNDGLKESCGDILIFTFDYLIIDYNIFKELKDNFKYNNVFKYSILKNIDNEENNIFPFSISRNYFKILNKFDEKYDNRFDFIYKDFFYKLKNINEIEILNIKSSIVSYYCVDKNYSKCVEYNGDNVKKLSLKEIYLMNLSMFNCCVNCKFKILNIIVDIEFNENKLNCLKNMVNNKNIVLWIIDLENIWLKDIYYLMNVNIFIVFNKNLNVIKKLVNNIYELENKEFFDKYIFMNVSNIDNRFNFYADNMKKYINILINKKKKIDVVDMKMNYINNFNSPNLLNYLKINNEGIFIFDDLAMAIIIKTHLINLNMRDSIEKFIMNSKYYLFMYEYFENEKLVITGCGVENYEFTKKFFKNSLKTLVLNTRNITYLLENNINNYVYYPAYGFSNINNISPLENKEKEIDVLWYGNIGSSSFFTYRKTVIGEISLYCFKNNIVFKKYDNLYENKNDVLSKTKIVIHIPQKKNYHVLSWAKIVELMCKKIFFIIEENEEIYNRNLQNIVCMSKRNNINDIINKINFYKNNEIERNKYIEKSYIYIKKKYNMDHFVSFNF
jgi:hypothetical protein